MRRAGRCQDLHSHLSPHLPLLLPVKHPGDGAQVVLADGVAAARGLGQEQKFFLNVRGEVQEVHNLHHPCRTAGCKRP